MGWRRVDESKSFTEDDAADIPVTNELAQNGKNYAC